MSMLRTPRPHPLAHRSGRGLFLVATAVAVAPLVVAVVALSRRAWHPALDFSMTEFRVRDAFTTDIPLIGLPGRLGTAAHPGSHPGPLSFYLLAPAYRLLGGSPWALEASSALLQGAAIVVALWIGYRRLGRAGLVATTICIVVAVHMLGQVSLTHPWNPHLPLLPWLVVVLAAWSVFCGDSWMAVPLVAAASYCSQTHISYLVLAVGLSVVAVGVAAKVDRRSALCASVVGLVAWTPVAIDQAIHDPGNARLLFDQFTSGSDPTLGFGDALRLAVRHFDVVAMIRGDLAARQPPEPTTWIGVVTVGVWLVVAGTTWRVAPTALRTLHRLLVGTGILGLVSMARITGVPWPYLTLWAWTHALLVIAAIGWSAVEWWRARPVGPPRPSTQSTTRAVAVGLAVAALGSTWSAVSFARTDIPSPRISRTIGALAGPTADAVFQVDGATGRGRVHVRIDDTVDLGGVGVGLANDLERRGLDVALDPRFALVATEHRTSPPLPGVVQVVVATGPWVERWRSTPDVIEVASYDPRSPEQLEQFNAAKLRVVTTLDARGRHDVARLVEENLFALLLSPEVPRDLVDDVSTLYELGEPTAVFVAPVGVAPAP